MADRRPRRGRCGRRAPGRPRHPRGPGPGRLAFVLAVVAHPLIGALARRGVRRGFAVAVAVLVVDGGLVVLVLALAVAVGQLATVLPEYSEEWQELLDGLRSTLAGWGVGPEQVEQALRSIGPRGGHRCPGKRAVGCRRLPGRAVPGAATASTAPGIDRRPRPRRHRAGCGAGGAAGRGTNGTAHPRVQT
ncbi:AI-2E family transporter [Geodermatophilus marinus]|nr:AI-2E family transporter [Geodermatophilus sp. LHW52908]